MSRKAVNRDIDALDLLRRDHDAIKQLFLDYQKLLGRHGSDDDKGEIVGRVCFEWCIHLQIEEEIFYPRARAALGPSEQIEHALRDHGGSRDLIALLDEMEPGDADFDATVAVLGAYVVPHIDEEQQDIFPLLLRAGLDTAALGRQMAQHRKALLEDVTRIGLPVSMSAAA